MPASAREDRRDGANIFAGRKVLVTGGTGMIGIQLVGLLLERGAKVRVASLDDPSRVGEDIEFMGGNLTEWKFCQRVADGMDYVFHLAGIKGAVGVGATRTASFFVPLLLMNTLMMEAARQAGVERFLYTSSIGIYHPSQVLAEDRAWDGPPHHMDRFPGWAKRMGELQAESYKIEYGWGRIAIVRPANVYGPYDNFDADTAMVVPALIGRVAGGEDPLVVWGDGSAVRDFIFSRDCAEGMLLALEMGADCIPINLGSGKGTSVKEVVEAITACFESPPRVEWDTSKPSGERIRLMDVTRAREKLGFTAFTPIRQGISETVEWFRASHESAGRRYNVFLEKTYI